MIDVVRCKHCRAALRLRPEYVGKKLRCPRCQGTTSVHAIQATPPAPAAQPVAYDLGPDDYDREPEGDDFASEWVACPRCGAQESERVLWTFWGSFYGPALFDHVECPACGTRYNGRTGRSNFVPALIFTLIPTLLIMGLLGVITWIILVRQF